MVGKVVCIVHVVEFLVGFLGGSFLKVDLSGVVKEKGRLQVLGCK